MIERDRSLDYRLREPTLVNSTYPSHGNIPFVEAEEGSLQFVAGRGCGGVEGV